jgi:3-oxoacyl-[acyl-carrier-protein] synthase II
MIRAMAAQRIVVTGVGVVSAAGVTREAFYDALATGQSGITRLADGRPIARVGDFGARAVLDAKALRRMARVSQMVLVAARQALAQSMPAVPPERSGIVLGTGLGTLRETYEYMKGHIEGGVEGASPLLFPSSVANAAAGQAALELGWRGANSTVNHRELSPLGALVMAADLLALGRADVLLSGGVEDASDVALHGYRRMGGLSPTGLRPYARDRDGTVLGEGAALLVLEREEDARARGATILAYLAGRVLRGENRPRVGWGSAWTEAARTLKAALAEASLSPTDIHYVAGGGAGLGVDALEARAVAAAFETPRPHGSILGQTGEFMASGVLRVAAALYALERQALPGTTGAGESDPEAPVPDLVRVPRAARVDAVLVPSLSQGGANAALVLTRK